MQEQAKKAKVWHSGPTTNATEVKAPFRSSQPLSPQTLRGLDTAASQLEHVWRHPNFRHTMGWLEIPGGFRAEYIMSPPLLYAYKVWLANTPSSTRDEKGRQFHSIGRQFNNILLWQDWVVANIEEFIKTNQQATRESELKNLLERCKLVRQHVAGWATTAKREGNLEVADEKNKKNVARDKLVGGACFACHKFNLVLFNCKKYISLFNYRHEIIHLLAQGSPTNISVHCIYNC